MQLLPVLLYCNSYNATFACRKVQQQKMFLCCLNPIVRGRKRILLKFEVKMTFKWASENSKKYHIKFLSHMCWVKNDL